MTTMLAPRSITAAVMALKGRPGRTSLEIPPFQGKPLAERTQTRARCPVQVIEVFAGLDLVGPRRATCQRRGFKRVNEVQSGSHATR